MGRETAMVVTVSKNSYKDGMLRSDQVKDNTADLIHVLFSVFFEYQCEFHSSYLTTLFSSFQLGVLTVGSSVFCLER